MTKHILLMDGLDRPGLIHHVTGVLFRHRLNIIRNDEYVSPDGQFFMRTEFEAGVALDRPDPQLILDELRQTLPDGVSLRLNPKQKKNVVVFVTKEHHCLGELLIRYGFDELGANILAVVSNYATLQPLVSKFGIPFHHISHEGKRAKNMKPPCCAPLPSTSPITLFWLNVCACSLPTLCPTTTTGS